MRQPVNRVGADNIDATLQDPGEDNAGERNAHRGRGLAGSAATLRGAGRPAAAADYPTRPITLVVPFPPGGSASIVARAVADKMSETLGQQIVIENRGGAGGSIGTRQVAKSAPDGYTLGLGGTGTLAIDPTLYPNAGYDPRKDFAPVGLIATTPNTAGGPPGVPGQERPGVDRPRQGRPASSPTARPASARSTTSAASVSRPPPASSSCTFPTRAPGRR